MWSSGSKSIDLRLLEPVIYVGSNLDTPPVVRGTVDITLNSSCMIKDIYIVFTGQCKTQYSEKSKVFNHNQSITSNHLALFPTITDQTPFLILNAGTSRFSFEMALPAGIPETVKCSQINVEYTMQVHLNYKKTTCTSAMQHEEIKKQVILARLPDSGVLAGENYPAIIDSHKHYSNWCQYRITIDKKAAALGSHLPVKIEIAPIIRGLRLKQVFLQLLEKRQVTPELDSVSRTTQSCHFIYPANAAKHQRGMIIPQKPLESTWEGYSEYAIPDNGSISHSTHAYKHFRVSHLLLVSLLVSVPSENNNGSYTGSRSVTRSISFQTEIDILDSHVTRLGECREYMNRLPSYNCLPSSEEIQKLNKHGFTDCSPPAYEEAVT